MSDEISVSDELWPIEPTGVVSAFYARPLTLEERAEIAREYRRLPNRLRRARRKLARPVLRVLYTWRATRNDPPWKDWEP